MIKLEFIPNNVEFQIVASKAWTDFFRIREFILNQLIVKESRFSTTCKETMLLSFNLTRLWLIQVEEDIKRMKHHSSEGEEFRTKLINENAERLSEYMTQMQSTMLQQTDHFDETYTQVFLPVFEFYKEKLVPTIKRKLKDDVENRFSELVVFMAQLMSHFLHILYELDYLIYSDKDNENFYPFLGLDSVDVNLYKERKVTLVAKRIEIYKKQGLIQPKAYWTIKSYCSKKSLDSDFEMFSMFRKLISEIELHGIRVSCVM